MKSHKIDYLCSGSTKPGYTQLILMTLPSSGPAPIARPVESSNFQFSENL